MGTTISTKRQAVIPKAIMAYLGLEPGEKIDFKNENGKIVVYPARRHKQSRMEDGAGMIKYNGAPVSLLEFDVAKLLHKGDKS